MTDEKLVEAVRQAFYRTGMNEDRIPTDVEIAAAVEALVPLVRAQYDEMLAAERSLREAAEGRADEAVRTQVRLAQQAEEEKDRADAAEDERDVWKQRAERLAEATS